MAIAKSPYPTSEQKLSENFLLEVFGSSRAVIYCCTVAPPYRFDFISSNLEQIFGYTPDEWKASPDIWKEIIHPQSLGRIASEMTQIHQTKLLKLQYQLRHKNGQYLWVEDHMRMIEGTNDSEAKLIGTVFDVTDIKMQEVQVVENSKMIALGQMASSIAHEINNPLTIISAKTRIISKKLAKEPIDTTAFQVLLDDIDQTCFRIAHIIKGLRNFSRDAGSDPMESLNIQRVIFDTIELCRSRFSENHIELRVEARKDIILNGRGTQLSQVLLNLLNNAFDAVIESKGERWVEVRCQETAEVVHLTVTDSGPGIPPNLRDKIMQPFFSTKSKEMGTGLGLSVSKGIIEEHGGQFTLNTSSQHTEFVIALPTAQKFKEMA